MWSLYPLHIQCGNIPIEVLVFQNRTDLMKPKDSVRLLGVMLDRGLHLLQHVREIRQKCDKKIAQLAALASSKVGPGFQSMRTFYKGILEDHMIKSANRWIPRGSYRQASLILAVHKDEEVAKISEAVVAARGTAGYADLRNSRRSLIAQKLRVAFEERTTHLDPADRNVWHYIKSMGSPRFSVFFLLMLSYFLKFSKSFFLNFYLLPLVLVVYHTRIFVPIWCAMTLPKIEI